MRYSKKSYLLLSAFVIAACSSEQSGSVETISALCREDGTPQISSLFKVSYLESAPSMERVRLEKAGGYGVEIFTTPKFGRGNIETASRGKGTLAVEMWPAMKCGMRIDLDTGLAILECGNSLPFFTNADENTVSTLKCDL